jgi:hypothetical protein
MWTFVCLSRQVNALLDGVETWNMADLERDHLNQKEKSKTRKILHQVFQNGG